MFTYFFSLQPVAAINYSNYRYCKNYPAAGLEPGELQYPCQYWGADSIPYPSREVGSIFVAKRAEMLSEEYQCGYSNTPATPAVEETCLTPFAVTANMSVYMGGFQDYVLGRYEVMRHGM